MKKIIAMLLALAMVFAMAACSPVGNKETEPSTEATTEVATEATDATEAIDATEATDVVEDETEPNESNEGFEDEEVVIEMSNMERLLNAIVEANPVEFMGMSMSIDLTNIETVKYYTGLDSAESIVEAAAFEPMMGSMAFSMVAVQVAEGADAEAVAEAIKTGVDTRKWICVEADDQMTAVSNDIVMMIMVDSKNGLTAQSFVDAFETVVAVPENWQK